MMEKTPDGLKIRRIIANRLFGYFDYELPPLEDNEADIASFFILYGDNGSGKTTILNLTYALLVNKEIPGAKTYIARTPFQEFTIELSDGTRISAKRPSDGLTGAYVIVVDQPKRARFEYAVAINERGSVTQELTELLPKIDALGVSLSFLPDDRRSSSPFSSAASQSAMETWAVDDSGRRLVERAADTSEQTHHLNIGPVLRRFSRWMQRQALSGSTQGEEDTTTIYQNIIAQIARPYLASPESSIQTAQELAQRISKIGSETQQFAKYGLLSAISADKFLEPLRHATDDRQATISTVLVPYLQAMEARIRALRSLLRTMDRFVEASNAQLFPKRVSVSIGDGVKIYDRNGVELRPNVLSSGEKQLLLIFCNAILVPRKSCIFIIDEPELSLNVKWQRQLLRSLSLLTEEGNVQFLLATHSLELLAKHQESTVHLSERRHDPDEQKLRI